MYQSLLICTKMNSLYKLICTKLYQYTLICTNLYWTLYCSAKVSKHVAESAINGGFCWDEGGSLQQLGSPNRDTRRDARLSCGLAMNLPPRVLARTT
jgi:hypothetical protein